MDAGEGHEGAGRSVGYFREAIEQDEVVEGATHRADERSASDIRVPVEALALEPGEVPRDLTGRERVWHSTFEEVRGWVAESPVAHKEAENRDVSRRKAATSTAVDSPFVEETAATTSPRPTVPTPREEPATQDLRLEIGTISVTVEEPHGEISRTSRRTEVPEKKSARTGERSRLSRHYVRIR